MTPSQRIPLCLIPARGGSKRLPRKNILPLGGRPLLDWTIAPALASGIFPTVYVSSEDDDILDVARSHGAEAVKRDPRLAGDRTTLARMCQILLPELADATGATDLYLMVPTSPFRSPETIRLAWETYLAGTGPLVSVAALEYPPQWALTIRDGRLTPLYPETYPIARPDLPQALRHDGGHLVTSIDAFLATGDFFRDDARPFFAPEHEQLDIDTPQDFRLAQSLLSDSGIPHPRT